MSRRSMHSLPRGSLEDFSEMGLACRDLIINTLVVFCLDSFVLGNICLRKYGSTPTLLKMQKS